MQQLVLNASLKTGTKKFSASEKKSLICPLAYETIPVLRICLPHGHSLTICLRHIVASVVTKFEVLMILYGTPKIMLKVLLSIEIM